MPVDRRPLRRRLLLALVSALALVGGLVSAAVPSGARSHGGGAKFIVSCKPGQRLADDPIMHPGKPGIAHMHQFFGSTATNAKSTVGQLQAARTTCDHSTDTAAYWMPTVYRQGKLVKDLSLTAYYRNTAKNPADIRAFPLGLKMMAGNAMATKAQRLTVAAWSCRQPNGEKTTYFALPPVCTTGRILVMKVWFPDCWDGRHLDSADHMSHLAYSNKGVCRSGMPVHIPQLAMTVKLAVPTVSGQPAKNGTAGRFDTSIKLASGSAYSVHADFWNTWNQSALNALVQKCLVHNQSCPSTKTG